MEWLKKKKKKYHSRVWLANKHKNLVNSPQCRICETPQLVFLQLDGSISGWWETVTPKMGCLHPVYSVASLVAQTVKNLPAMWETWVLSLGQEDTLKEGMNPLQDSCMENPMDRRAWQATVHRVAQSWTQLKRLNTHTVNSIISLWLLSLQKTLLHKHKTLEMQAGFTVLLWLSQDIMPWL